MNIQEKVSLNMDVRGLEQSATLVINDRSKSLAAEGRKIIKLGLGQSPFPVPHPVVEALKYHAHEKAYLPAKGLPELRTAVADFHRRHDGVERCAEDVLVGPGSKELMFMLQLVYYGELIVPTPCWVSYVPQAKMLGRRVSLIHTTFEDRWRITAEKLERRISQDHDQYRPRILMLNYPGNPDGCTYNADELKDLAEVARKFQVILLSDEIYGQLHFAGEHISVARYYPEGTIISSGLSKWCGAGGWRLGTFTFPPDLSWLLDAMAVAASETFTSVCAPIQCASVTAFTGGDEIERYLAHARRILSALGTRCARTLQDGLIRVHSPSGAFYLFLDFSALSEKFLSRGINNSKTLCERLLDDTGVAILPGEAFGRPCEELTARMAYVDFNGGEALAASEAVGLDHDLPDDFCVRSCSRVIEAMDLTVDWANR